MAGGLASAIIGPQLMKLTAQAMAIPFLATYLAIILINLAGPILFAFLDIPTPPRRAKGMPHEGRPLREILSRPVIVVAMITGDGLLRADEPRDDLDTAGRRRLRLHPVHRRGCDLGACSGDVYPSFFTGHLIARFGHAKIVGIRAGDLAGAERWRSAAWNWSISSSR